jgi:tetratricopeptide (TPR) repeat protein
MRHSAVVATALGLALASASPPELLAQLTTAGIRGRVIDQAGNPIPGVKLDMEFKGESAKPITKSQETDKKGGFVRMGIPDGPWQITFTKEGYRTYVMEINLSLGGFSEAGDIVLEPAPVAAPAPAIPGEDFAAPPDEAAIVGETYANAVEAAKAGRYDEAEAGLKEILAKHPDIASAHYNLGYVYRMRQDWKAAEAEYLRVTELEPGKADAHIALAAVREADGRMPDAVEGLLAAAPGFEADARFQYALGITCINAGRSGEAEAAFRRVLELEPDDVESRFQLGTILIGQAKTAEAVSMLEAYVGASGQNPANLETARSLIAALKK